MPHPTNHVQQAEGVALQAAALQELQGHAHRLIGGLSWITEDVAELVASINQLAEG